MSQQPQSQQRRERRWRPAEEGREVKRRPAPHPREPGHFYISKKTAFKAQLETCTAEMTTGKPIVLHAVGAAIPRCVNLALQLVENHHGAWTIQTNTSTVDLIDDVEPLNDDEDFRSVARPSSAIHIRLHQSVLPLRIM